jgi:hypothetical protein
MFLPLLLGARLTERMAHPELRELAVNGVSL